MTQKWLNRAKTGFFPVLQNLTYMTMMLMTKRINLQALLGCEGNPTSSRIVPTLERLHLQPDRHCRHYCKISSLFIRGQNCVHFTLCCQIVRWQTSVVKNHPHHIIPHLNCDNTDPRMSSPNPNCPFLHAELPNCPGLKLSNAKHHQTYCKKITLIPSPSHHIIPHYCDNTDPRMSSPVDLEVGELGKLLPALLAGVLDQLRVNLKYFFYKISCNDFFDKISGPASREPKTVFFKKKNSGV